MKFFYLDEDEKSLFTQWYANGEDVIACGHENSDVANAHCASRFEKYSENENERWIQCPALCQHFFKKLFLWLVFFPSKLKFGFFLLKMSFCRTETPFYDRPPVLISAFWHRKYNTGRKGFNPIKFLKSFFFSFFRNMQIFRIPFRKPQFYCRTDISEICHLNLSFKPNTAVILINSLYVP